MKARLFLATAIASFVGTIVALGYLAYDSRAAMHASSGGVDLTAPGPIGSGTPSSGAFTTLSASSTVSGTGFSAYLASPPAIGATAPSTVKATGFSTAASGTLTIQYGATVNDIVSISTAGTLNGKSNAGGVKWNLYANTGSGGGLIQPASDVVIGWASVANIASQTVDTGIARNAAGMVEINNGTAGTIADLKVKRIVASQATVPTCTTNCGTSPSVAGSDTGGIVTMGATGVPASGWVVTFNGTWPNAPACIVQSALSTMVVGKMPIAVVTTTTTMTVTTNGTAPATSDKYFYHCIGV